MPATPAPPRYAFRLGLFGLLLPLVVGIPAVVLAFPEKANEVFTGEILIVEFVALLTCAIGAVVGGHLDDKIRHEHSIDDRLERARRTRAWFWAFSLLALFCLAPCGLSILAAALGGEQWVLLIAMQSLVLLVLGLAGAVLMRADRSGVLASPRPGALESLAQQGVANGMGFTYTEMPPAGAFEWVEEMRLWAHQAWGHAVRNVLTGKAGGLEIAILQHTLFRSELGAYRSSHQTLYAARGLSDLPSFVLVPRSARFPVSPSPGEETLFRDDGRFAVHFTALGDDRAAERLTPEVRRLCLARPSCYVEARHGLLVLCVPGLADQPNDYGWRIAHLVRLVAAIRAAA